MAKHIRRLLSVARCGASRAGMLLLVIMGFAGSGSTQVSAGNTVNERVLNIRARVQSEQLHVTAASAPDDSLKAVQWGNWGNWRNWSNWNNWRNWGNWGNWRNF